MKTMKQTLYIITGLAALLTMPTSCVKDELYNLPRPDTGKISVTADWSRISPDAFVPEQYDIVVDGTAQRVSGATNTLDRTLPPGEYELLLHNNPDGFTINGDMAAVDATGNGEIEPMPGFLFAGTNTVTVKADADIDVTVPMTQFVRRLNIELTVVEGDHSRITSATATLGGVESAMDMRQGVRAGTAASVSVQFSQSGNMLTVSYNLLGIVHAATPKLVTTLLFSDGQVQTVESDLSDRLADFHGGITPLTLTASLSVPLQAGMSATIDDWRVTDGGNVDAH